jgi:hypothetical protein
LLAQGAVVEVLVYMDAVVVVVQGAIVHSLVNLYR